LRRPALEPGPTAEDDAMPMDKTFTAAEAEARISKLWLEARAFAAGANARPGAPAFSVMIPPPNVTGSLHMGHAFNNTLQDILVRWHRMRGHDVLWQPGTDHAGIATQMVTEREMAQAGEPDRRTLGREAFTARVWQQKQRSRGTIIGQLQRLGCSCDWEREAFTMSGAPGAPAGEEGNFHDAVIKVFVDLYHKGLITRGKRLVNWDPQFETAISDLEVENTEVDGHMWHFKYPLAGGATYEHVERDAEGRETLREVRDYISIATTRPETMLGDGAVAVNPSDARYAGLVGTLCEIPVGPKEHRRLIPIIADDYPDPAFGSGAVKITGAHDFNDHAVARRNGIPCYRLMDTRARMRTDGAPYAEAAAVAAAVARGERSLSEAEVDALNLVPDHLRGLDRYEARARVVEEITAEGLAVMTRAEDPRLGKPAKKPAPAAEPGPLAGGEGGEEVPGQARDGVALVPLVEAKKIMQPFGDRSKVVIEPMLTDQWFVDTAKIVGPALEAVRSGRTVILPESGEKTYYHWLENIEPWCISRQLWWGHQIPVWYGLDLLQPTDGGVLNLGIWQDLKSGDVKVGEHFFCAANELAALDAASDHYRREFAGNSIKIRIVPSKAAAIEFIKSLNSSGELEFPIWRDPDVLDTWFSSGLWPIGTLGWPDATPELQKYFPTSVLVTGQDILFFWVARMMMMQLAVVGEVPFRTVYLHGLVRDAKGRKMSKSVGNVVDPLDLIDEFGADALRFSNAAMASLGGVLKLDAARIAGYRNFGTKLWNACRFAEMNGVWEGHATGPAPSPRATANRWILGETAATLAIVDRALEEFRFDQAADAIYRLVWGKVCDWYVEFAKPLFDGPDAAETRATMAFVLDRCLMMLHPFMPFLTEELWGLTGTRATLLVHADWPELPEALIDPAAMEEMRFVTTLIDDIRSARAQVHVPVGLKADLVAVRMTEAARRAFARNEALIRRMARIGTVREGEAPRGSIAVAAEGAAFAIPLEGLIDLAAERARLQKALEKLGKEIGGLKGRLGNPNFARSAPEEVVQEAEANLAAREEEARKLQEAMARLADLA
jgi:valyl-tRNA synthetase